MAAKHDFKGFEERVLGRLGERLRLDGAVEREPAPAFVQRDAGRRVLLTLGPNTKGLPRLLLNPAALLEFDVGATLLARRATRPGADPATLPLFVNWSTVVTSRPPPSFVRWRTRVAWKLRAPPPFLDATVDEEPAAAAARLEG